MAAARGRRDRSSHCRSGTRVRGFGRRQRQETERSPSMLPRGRQRQCLRGRISPVAGNERAQFLRCRKGAAMSVAKKLQGTPVQTRTISRRWGLVAMLVLLDWVAVARAQDVATAPPGTRSLAPTLFQLTLPSAHLLGDWYGVRPWLEDHGITPTVTFVTDALGNPTGGREQGFTGAHNLGLDLLFDLEKLAGLRGGSFHFSLSQRFGTSLSTDYIGNVFTVQQVFGGETFRVVNLAYQQTLLDDRVEFSVCRIAAGDDFLVSPYNYVFVQNGFDGNPVGIFFNSPGMTAYPNDSWGALLKVRPTARTYIMGGVYNGDPSIRD